MSTTWLELRRSLVERGQLHEVFDSLSDVSWGRNPKQYYEPLLITEHIERLSDLVDRCLSLRRDIRDLEILAVKSGAEYELFIKTSELDEEIEKLRLLANSRQLESEGHKSATENFGDASTIERGYKAISMGLHNALQDEVSNATKIAALIEDRWKQVRSFQAAYRERFTESGNAHNYGERASSLMRILGLQVTEALGRTEALRIGLKSIYSWDATELPNLLNLATLDEFAVWLLRVKQELGLRNEHETVADQVVPLVQPWFEAGSSVMKREEFDAAIGQTTDSPVTLRFSLDRRAFFGQEVRLKGVGLAFGNRFGLIPTSGVDSIQTADSFARLSIKIRTPLQNTTEGDEYRRPDIVLGNVSLHQNGQPAAFYEGVCIDNISPFGVWEFQLHPWIVWKDATAQKLNSGVLKEKIRDLKLMFRVYSPAKATA